MVTDAKTAWTRGRPVYGRLPQKGYQDNEVADWLTQGVDMKLTEVRVLLEGLYTWLEPGTCPDHALDFLGWLVGFSGQYWDTEWSTAVKRAMIAGVNDLWRYRGTRKAIDAVMAIHGYTHSIWQQGDLRLPFRLGQGRFGTPDLSLYIRLPLGYHRSGREWREARRTLGNFAPAVIRTQVCYQGFYLGLSQVGEPLFTL